ncbi:disulfide bond formation protein B [Defluviicoccus vanus]|uniref:Disulfide bond formation protein B n=2 Tax=Defluviicoccus vanus TaxID=111831 RepID=A0A7H1N555_9PROT|nr:disulfide bond formation protein B [Defluviicoccus vanus]
MDTVQRRPQPITVDPVRMTLAALLVVGLGAIGMALVGQFAFGLVPCILCLYQRVPYAVVAGLSALGVLLPLTTTVRRRLVAMAGVVFLVGAAIAFYHVGVEAHWWAAATGCAGTPVGQMTMEQFQAQIFTPQKPCDQVDVRFLGLSLAGWNTIASLVLAVGCLLQSRRLSSGSST